MPADGVSYTLPGQDINFDVSDNFVAQVGIFALNAEDVALDVNFYVLGGDASFSVTGQDVEFIDTNLLTVETGYFTATYDDARLEPDLTLPAETGQFTLDGQLAGIQQYFVIDGVGLFSFDGQDAAINAARARRFEYAGNLTGVQLSQANPNSAIITQGNNEAA
jgi:hypothetical protein